MPGVTLPFQQDQPLLSQPGCGFNHLVARTALQGTGASQGQAAALKGQGPDLWAQTFFLTSIARGTNKKIILRTAGNAVLMAS